MKADKNINIKKILLNKIIFFVKFVRSRFSIEKYSYSCNKKLSKNK